MLNPTYKRLRPWVLILSLFAAAIGEAQEGIEETEHFLNKRVLQNPDNPSWPFKYYARRLLFSPDGKHLIVWDEYSDKVHIWDVDKQEVVAEIEKRRRTDPDYAYVEGGKYLVGTRPVGFDEPHEFVVHETTNYEEVDTWQPPAGTKTLLTTPDGHAMTYSPGRKGQGSPVRLTVFDVIDKTVVNQLSDIDGFDIIAFSPDGREFADGMTEYYPGKGVHNNKYHIRIWKYPELTTRLQIDDAHPGQVSGLVYNSSGSRLYSWSGSAQAPEWYELEIGKRLERRTYGEPIKVWNIETGELVNEVHGIIAGLVDMYLMPDDRHMVMYITRRNEFPIVLLDLQSGEIVDEILPAAEGRVAVTMSRDKGTIAIGVSQSIVILDLRIPE